MSDKSISEKLDKDPQFAVKVRTMAVEEYLSGKKLLKWNYFHSRNNWLLNLCYISK